MAVAWWPTTTSSWLIANSNVPTSSAMRTVLTRCGRYATTATPSRQLAQVGAARSEPPGAFGRCQSVLTGPLDLGAVRVVAGMVEDHTVGIHRVRRGCPDQPV